MISTKRSRDNYYNAPLFRYLGYSLSKIRAQDTLSVIVYVSRNIQGRYLAWNFVRSKWPVLRET